MTIVSKTPQSKRPLPMKSTWHSRLPMCKKCWQADQVIKEEKTNRREKTNWGEGSKPCWEDNTIKIPADIIWRLRARHHNQKDHCQRNQPGIHDCQCAKNANRQTNTVRKRKPTEWKKLTRKNETAKETIANKINLAFTTTNVRKMLTGRPT